MVFGGLNIGAVVCFVLCFTLLPFLAIKPSKFAILYVSPALSLQPSPSLRHDAKSIRDGDGVQSLS